jgi:transposase
MGSQDRSVGSRRHRRYSDVERAQAVRLVRQAEVEGRGYGAVRRVAEQLGYGVESVRSWVQQDKIDAGEAAGVTTVEAARIKDLEAEVRELRRANEIVKRASAFFAAELDRPCR